MSSALHIVVVVVVLVGAAPPAAATANFPVVTIVIRSVAVPTNLL